MLKKGFVLCLTIMMLFSAMAIPAFAAEKKADLELVSAEIKNANDEQVLEIVIKNKSDIGIFNAELYIDSFNDESITFSETCYINSTIVGLVKEIAPKGTGTYLFELDACADPNVQINIGVLYRLNKSEVYAGDIYNDKNYEKWTASDILKAEKAPAKLEVILNFLKQSGFSMIGKNWKVLVMILISFVLIYLAIAKQFEPLLLLPIAFGMLLTNLPGAGMYHPEFFADGHVHWDLFTAGGGLIDYLYLGVKLGIYPCLIFLGIGAMTDFGPLLANPKSLLLGAAAQLGIFITYFCAVTFFGFTPLEASSIGIIGGADGPTAIFVTSKLAPHLLGPIAVAAYSYMALVPVIQPPIMKALTTKKERMIKMDNLRSVSKKEKILFPIVVTVFVAFLVPDAAALVGCLMLGNLMRESGVVDRITKAAQNELMNIVTIFLGISVGATATAETFLNFKTISILVMGVVAFGFGSAGGVLLAKFMNLFLKKKINPLIGSAGVSAVPMAARVSQTVGQKEDPSNFLLMHAMGPNVAGVIGSTLAAGVLIALFG